MADGLFYCDLREPFVTVVPNAVTLASTAKALYTASQFPVLGGQYWSRVGKKMRITLRGQMTTAATPGNGSFDIYYGSGADATGTILASSAALALVANGSALAWAVDIVITCRSIGSAGTLMCMGKADFNVGLLLSTAAPMMIPASSPVVSAGVDLTAANIISVQFKRSGSTAETMQVLEMEVYALN